ncbi:MAG: T9SS type A sorting domain-containing protein, partial [Ekhidna sp.]|nr:T9SS type A sorting domain-containing protein [Ekhidna sp.]
TLITWTYTHNSKSIVQTQTVTITEDTTPPTVTGSLAAVTAQCPINAETDLTEPAAPADNCGGTVNVALKTDTTFPITESGTITWVYTDENGNMSEQTQDVTINKAPVPVLPDLPVISEACKVEAGDVTAPEATDCSGTTVTGTPDAAFPMTANGVITWTYEDNAGSTTTQTQEVTITDVLVPEVNSLLLLNEQCEIASLAAPTARNCAGNTLTAEPDVTPPITTNTTITWTYTDGSKTATQTQEVTIDDTMPPRVSGTLTAITAACSLAEDDLPEPTATDNCDGTLTAETDASFPIMESQTITWTYRDKSGNEATQTQKVTITPCVLSAADDALEAVVFPNPSGRYVEVQSPVESPIRVLSLGGELVLKSTTNTRIDAASLQSGLYLIQLPDGRLLKFIKQ